MRNKKWIKVISLVLSLTLIVIAFAACGKGNENPSESQSEISTDNVVNAPKLKIRFATLKGPTGIGAVELMKANQDGTSYHQYDFQVLNAPDAAVAAMTSGQADVAAVPINLASSLYKATNGNIQVLAVNTLGVLYIMENGDSIQSFADLKGKTIGATGKGATPQYVLEYLLKANGIDPEKDVTIEYKSEHAELATLLASGKIDIAMLPEPNVTSVKMQNKDLRVALNLTEEWETVAKKEGKTDSSLVQGVIIAKKDFVEANKDAVAAFLNEYKKSIDYVNGNVDDAAQLVETFEIIPKAAIAKNAIPNCNITFIEGERMKSLVQDNLTVLFNANPKAVGGALPNEDFYFAR